MVSAAGNQLIDLRVEFTVSRNQVIDTLTDTPRLSIRFPVELIPIQAPERRFDVRCDTVGLGNNIID
jgi:hypothetical protein